ncbi:MAG: cupin domain-containing protein [Rhodobacteraceae bacterium]|nr:MAG: cupin domain-containing protein [Paracoccaceae bacterium]
MPADQTTRPQATHAVLMDDARVRVTRWDFPPGAETGWHRHAHDYVVTPLTDLTLRLEDANGSRVVTVAKGSAYGRAEGTEHNVINDGDAFMSFVEIELK